MIFLQGCTQRFTVFSEKGNTVMVLNARAGMRSLEYRSKRISLIRAQKAARNIDFGCRMHA